MSSKRTDLLVGLFVIAGALALLFLALKAGNLASFSLSSSNYDVVARFDNIGGLKVRAPVKSAGVVVGRVSSLGFDNQTFQAVATLSLDQKYKFPKDTSAKILTSGLLGEQYIGLEAGGDPDNLASGDRIVSTQSAIVLENLISQFLFSKAADGPQAPAGAAAAPAAGAGTPAAASGTPSLLAPTPAAPAPALPAPAPAKATVKEHP